MFEWLLLSINILVSSILLNTPFKGTIFKLFWLSNDFSDSVFLINFSSEDKFKWFFSLTDINLALLDSISSKIKKWWVLIYWNIN